MAYSQSWESVTAQVKEQTDIVQIIGECVELKRSGVRYLGLCPFHGEKTPSFSVHSGQQFYYCFGCGESGDVFSFMMKYYNLDFPAALKELARRSRIELPDRPLSEEQKRKNELRQAIYRVNEKAAGIFRRMLLTAREAETARQYLKNRDVPADIQERFAIGYAPSVETSGWEFLARQLSPEEKTAALAAGLLVSKEKGRVYDRFRDRILFPIFNNEGKIAGFGGRIVGEGQPKYMNSPESLVFDKSRLLLGLHQQQEVIRRQRRAVLVEGNFDMISLVAHGCENVVAPLGTALGRKQIRILHRLADTVILLFDGDAAGLKAAIRAVPLFLGEQVDGKVALLPVGHDPDTFIREKGAGELASILEQAEPLAEFILDQLVKEHGLTLSGKNRIIQELLPLLKEAGSSLQRSVMIAHFAEKIGVAPEQIAATLAEPQPKTALSTPVAVATEKTVLSPAQKRLVSFLVLNPAVLLKLETAGIREILAGGIGEILFLQLKTLVQDRSDVQPEDLLTVLPPGAEHDLVTEILLQASTVAPDLQEAEGADEEIVEVMEWLKIEALKIKSRELLNKIIDCQGGQDKKTLPFLLEQKQKVDRELDALKD